MSEEHAQDVAQGQIHQDLVDALDQLEEAVSAHITNPLFRDLADKAVEMVRGVVDAHVKI